MKDIRIIGTIETGEEQSTARESTQNVSPVRKCKIKVIGGELRFRHRSLGPPNNYHYLLPSSLTKYT